MKQLCYTLLIIFTFLTIISCSEEKESLETIELFEISYGKMANQLDVFEQEKIPSRSRPHIYMRNGLFYIANGNSAKIMQFNSYGDLLALYYNKDRNPTPVTMAEPSEEGIQANRKAFPYSFNQLGDIAVSPNKMILAEDKISRDHRTRDNELNAMLDRVVLRFNMQGKLIDYLGQEGIGGTPFPYIERVQVTKQGNPIVICKTTKHRLVYWFTEEGILKYKVKIALENLPKPKQENIIASMESIYAAPDKERIYMKIDYYEKSIDTATGAQSGVSYTESRVYWLDMDQKTYTGNITVPENIKMHQGTGVFDREEVRYLYEFLGTTSDGYLFFLSTEEVNSFKLLIMDTTGTVIERKAINLENEIIHYKSFHLSAKGILSALISTPDRGRIVWWRSDKLIEVKDDENSKLFPNVGN